MNIAFLNAQVKPIYRRIEKIILHQCACTPTYLFYLPPAPRQGVFRTDKTKILISNRKFKILVT